MTQTEELKARIGIDQRPLEQGLKGSKQKVGDWAKDIKSQFNRVGDFFKGFGAAAFLGDAKQITGAIASWIGDISVFGVTGKKAVQAIGDAADKIRDKFKKMNLERWTEEKKITEQAKNFLDAVKNRIMALGTEQEKLMVLAKEANRAEEEYMVSLYPSMGIPVSRQEELKTKAFEADTAFQKFKIDLIKKQRDEQNAADKERVESFQKEIDKTKELIGIEKERRKERSNLTKLLADVEKLRPAQAREKYLPTIEELAAFGKSPASRDAQRIMFLEEDTRLANLYGNFDYANKNIKEIDSLKKGLQDKGFLPDDKFERAAKAAEESQKSLDSIVERGIKIQSEP